MKRIVILISGRGSNMQAIIAAARTEQWPAKIVAVISNRDAAPGLEFAARQQIATAVVPSKQYADRALYDTALMAAIDSHQPDLVLLAGFMRILTPAFVAHYAGRLLNIHPSLLPSFPGLDTHRRALQAGVKLHGATVHFVSPEVDAGLIVAQAAVPVCDDDDEQRLAARVLEQEHVIYPRVVRAFVEGRLRLRGGRVQLLPAVETQTEPPCATGRANGIQQPKGAR